MYFLLMSETQKMNSIVHRNQSRMWRVYKMFNPLLCICNAKHDICSALYAHQKEARERVSCDPVREYSHAAKEQDI